MNRPTGNLLRGTKIAAYIMAGLFAYALIGSLTYQYHEHLFPGVECHEHDGEEHCNGDGSVGAGVLWPVAGPVTAAIDLSRRISEDVSHD